MIQRMREATLRPPGDLILDAEGNSIRWAQGTGMRMGEEKDDASSMEEWARGTGMRIGEHPPAGVDPKSALGKALANADPNDKTLRPPGVLKDAAGNPVPMFGTGEESIRYETMEGPGTSRTRLAHVSYKARTQVSHKSRTSLAQASHSPLSAHVSHSPVLRIYLSPYIHLTPASFSCPGTREAEYARMIARMRTSMLRPPGVLKAADGTPVPIFGAGGADVVGAALLYDAKKNPCGYDAREIARMRQAVLFPPGELLDAKGNAVPIYDGSPLPDPMDYESPSSYAYKIAQMRISTLRAPGDLKDADGKPVPI